MNRNKKHKHHCLFGKELARKQAINVPYIIRGGNGSESRGTVNSLVKFFQPSLFIVSV